MTSKKLWDSGTFKFSVGVLCIATLLMLLDGVLVITVTGYKLGQLVGGEPITGPMLLGFATTLVGIYAGKEGFRYGSEAYKERG